MFPNYHKNLIKPKINKAYVFINIFVVFFSLNFNSFLFAPTFADEVLATEPVIQSTVVENSPVAENPSLEEAPIIEEPVIENPVVDETLPQDTGNNQGDILSGSSEFLDEVPVVPDIGPNLDEVLTGGLDSHLSGNLQEIVKEIIQDQNHSSGLEEILSGSQNTGIQENVIQIDQGYFDLAFERGVYNHKVFDLQNILISLGFLSGALNGIYDENTIEAVYQYQLSKAILTDQDSVALRGFFGPGTRTWFDKEYVTYKQNLLNGISNVFGGGSMQNFVTEKDKYAELLNKVKEYFIQNRYSLESIFGTGVFVGNEDIDFSMLSGKIDLPLIFQSSNTLDGNIAEVTFEEGTVLKTEDGNIFTGTLISPEFLDKSVADELTGQDVISVLDVGGNDEKILLEDLSGTKISSKIKMPAPGQKEGNLIDINYSNDGQTWTYMASQKVFLKNGEPYVEFETTHFTVFAISLPIGTFFINNDVFSTNGTTVTLNSDISGATHMRFANTGVSLTGAARVTYNTGYSWNILTGDGYKTVYAQFSGSYGIQSISDTIFLNTSNTGGNLKVSLNGSMNSTNVLDTTANANAFSGMGGIGNPILSGEQVFSFNGTSQYAQRTGIGLTAYPFTISAWVNTTKLGTTQSIVHLGNSGSTTIYYGLEITTTGYPAIVARNTTSYVGTSPMALATGVWYHIVGVFASATSRILYVNGDQMATQVTSTLFSGTTNPQIRVGRYVGSTTNYFTGYMDDIRIYNKTLSIWDIKNIYASRVKVSPPVQYINDGEFNINTGTINTYTSGVTLVSDVTGMTHMRFANNTGALAGASWVLYSPSYSRFLSGSTGNNIVYAQYSGVGGVRDAQDNIFLDSVSDANLKVLLAGNMNATNVLDSTSNANAFSGFGSMTNPILTGEQVFSLNGTSQYAQRTGIGLTVYPFTLSAWVNPRTIAGNDAIIMMGNSGTTTTYYGIQLVAGAASMVATNTTATTTTSLHILSTGAWYHVVGVFNSATDRRLYVNGNLEATNATSTLFSGTINPQIRVGRYVATATNYFDGYIDDVRIYNKTLSTGEVVSLYQDRSVRGIIATASVSYSTTVPTTNPVIATLTGFSENGITIVNNNGSGLYTFTGNGNFTFMFKDSHGNIGSTIASVDWITQAGGSLSLSGPASFSFGSTGVAGAINSLEKSFTGASDYFDVVDGLGADPGYYTTLAFSDLQYNSIIISKSNIYIKTSGGITLRAGTANANVVTAITGVYLGVSSPLTFIKRDAASNGGKTGTYGAQVVVKIDIPALQQPANYTGTIIYTLY